jgi:hypothetical protein
MNSLAALTLSRIELPGLDALEEAIDDLIALIDEAIGTTPASVTASPGSRPTPGPEYPMFHHRWGLRSPPNSARAAY